MGTRARPARRRSIRVLLAGLFVVPLASLLALWGFAASVTLSNAIQEHNFNNEDRLYGGWAQTLGTQLALERLQSFEWLSSGRHLPEGPMLAQQRATDAAVTSFRTGMGSSPAAALQTARPELKSFYNELNSLPGIRTAIVSGKMTALAAFQAYGAIVDAQFRLYSQLVAVNNASLYQQAEASVQAGRALEMADREVTLISGAIAAGGQMSKAERILFAQNVAEQRLLIGDALRQLDPSLGSGYQRAYASAAYKSFAAIEAQITNSIGNKGPLAINPLVLGGAIIPLFKEFQSAEAQDRVALSHQGTQVGDRLLVVVSLAGGAGLVAVALSVYLMIWFGRRISRELTGLQRTALQLATDRLPRVVERLSRGEEVDVAAETAPPAAWRIAETARVAEAFSSVQRTAVQAAIGQARLRKGVSQVFLNLAWRSQSLLHRQLALLDAMERKSTEPEALDELFRLDHLTTRMRRHAEGLIILSGSAPGRGWGEPVPVIDVLRGAIAEVEDYTRVSVITESGDAVVGAAVADVIHLLAELIENATTYSPAHTEVTVRAERVANGFVAEVEDRGIGISDDELAAVNDRLANPPDFDLADSDRLGLFVVARLAAKHHIKITLRPSPYGGTAAIVLLPRAIVVARDTVGAQTGGAFLGVLALPAGDGQGGVGARVTQDTAGRHVPAGMVATSHETHGPSGLMPDAGAEECLRSAAPVQAPAELASAEPGALAVGTGPEIGGPPGWDLADVDAATGRTRLRLPQRVRQASIAPQLTDAGLPSAGDAPQPGSTDGRTPAERRTLVDELQHGWLRGRTEAAPLDDLWAPAGSTEQAAMSEDREGT